jgi:drug/metabolite transporter (DMT)-like permease
MVSATDAQVVFSTVPLWSVLFAVAVLHEDGFGALTWAGGAALVGATLVASLGPDSATGKKGGTREL